MVKGKVRSVACLDGQQGKRRYNCIFINLDNIRGWVVDATRPGRLTTPLPPYEMVSIAQETEWAPQLVGAGIKSHSPPPLGFESRSVQPVAGRYT